MCDSDDVTELAIADISIDNSYQMREEIPDCSEYAELMGGGKWPFPPVVVFKLGRGKKTKLQLVSGFTRVAAAKAAKRSTVPAIVKTGTAGDALMIALGENDDHGYRRTAADKRKAVLKCKGEFPDFGTRAICDAVKVSRGFVLSVFKDIAGEQGVRAVESTPEAKGKKTTSAPAKDPTANYGDCPVCGAKKWEEHDDGVKCVACGHYHGEVAAKDDEETPKGDGKKKIGSSDTASDSEGKAEKPLADRIKTGMAEVGKLTRLLEELGLLDQSVASSITKLRNAIVAVKD